MDFAIYMPSPLCILDTSIKLLFIQSYSMYQNPFHQIDFDSGALAKQHHKLVKRFAGCLLEEYENATAAQFRDSQWMKQLLLPHMEKFHQVSNLVNILQSP